MFVYLLGGVSAFTNSILAQNPVKASEKFNIHIKHLYVVLAFFKIIKLKLKLQNRIYTNKNNEMKTFNKK